MTEPAGTPLGEQIDTATAEAGATAQAAADTAGQSVKGLIEQHPIAMLAGGILIGALIASAIPRRRAGTPVQTAAGNLGQRASRLAAIGAQLATAYAARAGREGSEKLEDLGEMISETSGEAKRRTGEMADGAATAFRELSTVALRHASEIAARLKR